MKKLVYIIFSLVTPLLLTAPALAMPKISAHPGVFRVKGVHLAGTTLTNSTNWSGYAAVGANGTYNSVSSSWTQPSVNCAALSQNAYSSYWVGLDGYNDQTVEQIGSEADCVNHQARYYAWYELYPANPYELTLNLRVNPGDKLSATVKYLPSSTVRLRGRVTSSTISLSLTDNSTGRNFSTNLLTRTNYLRSSAEVITEAPYSGGILPLADYGLVNYSVSQANSQPLGSQANLVDIVMQNPAGMTSTPSAFDVTHQNFNTVWAP